MTNDTWEAVDQVPGQIQAALIESLLTSYGIKVWISQEGAGQAYAFNIGSLGRVEVLVPQSQVKEARDILRRYHAGEMELPGEDEEPEQDNLEE
jgi:hypothetical protein